jgi:hypothetical protein
MTIGPPAEISVAEFLTMTEIESRYPDECVVLVEPDQAQDRSILAGLVVYHSPDAAAADRVTDGIRREHPAVVCVDTTPYFVGYIEFTDEPEPLAATTDGQ